MARNYYIMNDNVCNAYGYNKYITLCVPDTDIIRYNMRLAMMADFIITCDDRGYRYVKNRRGDLNEPIDSEELMLIILSSTEDVFKMEIVI